jgi:hypothetical protein
VDDREVAVSAAAAKLRNATAACAAAFEVADA